MAQKWNTDAQAKLLTGILTVLEVKVGRDSFDKLAAYMGPEYSWNGVRQYIQKVKAGVIVANGAANGRTSSAKQSKTTPKKRGKNLADSLDNDDNASPADDGDDDQVPTPSKRAKKTPRASALKAEALIKQAEEARLADEQEEAELARRRGRGHGNGSNSASNVDASRATEAKTELAEESGVDEAFGCMGEGQGIQDPFGGHGFELEQDGNAPVAQDHFPGFTPVNGSGGLYGYDLEQFGFGGFGGAI